LIPAYHLSSKSIQSKIVKDSALADPNWV